MTDDDRLLKIWETRDGKKVGDAFEFLSRNHDCFVEQDVNLECAVEAFADKFYHDHDGWESSWPIIFHIEDIDGTFLGLVSVDCEVQPTFSGSVVAELARGEKGEMK